MPFTNRSPSESWESWRNWSRRERCILDTLHETHPPTHEAVVKFGRPVKPEKLKLFQDRVAASLRYWRKKHGHEFAVYFVREIERDNCVHYHFLIRTAVPFPRDVLKPIVENAAEGLAILRHCEAVDNVAAITRYVVKDIAAVDTGEKEVLLFKRSVGLHLSGGWNGYFVWTKGELWEKWKQERYGSAAKPTKRQRRHRPQDGRGGRVTLLKVRQKPTPVSTNFAGGSPLEK
jgi:hypothetical protein